jgi:hypothetical protein
VNERKNVITRYSPGGTTFNQNSTKSHKLPRSDKKANQSSHQTLPNLRRRYNLNKVVVTAIEYVRETTTGRREGSRGYTGFQRC